MIYEWYPVPLLWFPNLPAPEIWQWNAPVALKLSGILFFPILYGLWLRNLYSFISIIRPVKAKKAYKKVKLNWPCHGMKVGWNHSKQGKNSCTWEPAKVKRYTKQVRSLEQRSLKDPNNFFVKSPIWSTWMSSSLLANSDTKTFFPSAIRVRDTQSLPEARRWASSGSFFSRESLTVRSRLKVGWKTPRVCFLASFAVVKISAHNCSEGENEAEPNVQAKAENQWHYDVSLHYPHV